MTERHDPPVRTFKPKDPDVIPLSALVESQKADAESVAEPAAKPGALREIGGRQNGLDPTRYGDWEKDGRCIDF